MNFLLLKHLRTCSDEANYIILTYQDKFCIARCIYARRYTEGFRRKSQVNKCKQMQEKGRGLRCTFNHALFCIVLEFRHLFKAAKFGSLAFLAFFARKNVPFVNTCKKWGRGISKMDQGGGIINIIAVSLRISLMYSALCLTTHLLSSPIQWLN